MKAIQLLLVSVYVFFYNNIVVVITAPQTHDIISMSESTPDAAFSFNEWKQTFLLSSNLNYSNDFNETVSGASAVIKCIYIDVLCLLLGEIYHLTIRDYIDLKSIEYYLGFNTETIDMINVSMTELLAEQRAKKIAIQKLENLFYYSCDLKYTLGNNGVKTAFQSVINEYLPFINNDILLQLDKAAIVNGLKSDLQSLSVKTNATYGVNIRSMKMRVLLEPTDDIIMKMIQNRSHSMPDENNLSKLVKIVKLLKTSKIGTVVNYIHLMGLAHLLLHLFGYVHNHFVLLSKLRAHISTIDEEDKKIIEQFSPFMNGLTLVLFERLIEFSKEPNQHLKSLEDDLYFVMYFLNPFAQNSVNAINVTDKKKSDFYTSKKPDISMSNYYVTRESPDEFDNKMWLLVNAALKGILSLCMFIDKSKWNNSLQISIGIEEDNKKGLLELMTTNNKNAIQILTKLIQEITLENDYTIYTTKMYT